MVVVRLFGSLWGVVDWLWGLFDWVDFHYPWSVEGRTPVSGVL